MVKPAVLLRLLRSRLRAYWSHSLRRQLSWSFGLTALMTMVVFSLLLYSHQRAFLYSAATDRAQGMAQALAASSASWVLANDVAGLQEVLDGVAGTTDLKFALVLSQSGEVLASTQKDHLGQYLSDPISAGLLRGAVEPRVLVNQATLLDIAYPVMAGKRHVGWVRLEMTRQSANANLQALGRVGLGFSLLAAALASLVAIWLARRLTRGLYRLMNVAAAVEHGQRQMRSGNTHADELGQLARSLDRMLDALDDSERKLERLNRLYAAWTESTDIIVRKTEESQLLNEICHVLAERVPFHLVWVGVPDDTGQVVQVAASAPDSPYLRSIRVVLDGSRPEGHGPMGTAIREGMPRIFNDFLHDPETRPWHQSAAAENFGSVAAFPLLRGGRVYGGIAVYSSETGFFTTALITLMNGLADDISFALDNLDRERERQAVTVKLELAARVFEHSTEGIMVTDADGNIISVNRGFTAITGYSEQEAIGRNPRLLASGRHNPDFYRRMWKSLRQVGNWRGEIWNRRSNGEVYPELLTITSVRNEAGGVINYIAIFGDISERKEAEQRIQQLAQYDVLTGLPNRLLFADRLQQGMVQSRRNDTRLAVLFLDLDRFKQINDTLGHDVGDELLKVAAQRLGSCVREQDTVSRQGGDEFIAVLPGTDAAGAAMVAEKMLQAVVQPYRIHGHDLRVTTSIGIAIFPDHALDGESLVKYADVAMYQAKESGRNHYLHFDPGMNASAYERLALETGLRVALEDAQFQLYYQLQVNLADGRIVGCEALIRWLHPRQGMISPASFIPLAEETGLIGPISDWVLEEAVRQCRAWSTAGLPPLRVSVNLSALQFRQRNLYEQVSGLLLRHDLPPQLLELELTETILMQGVERTLSTLHELTALGVSIAIDDFGTGYSSLSYLKRFPIQKLKIDQTFVRDIISDSNDAAMVRTIILMARSLNLRVIAEGVETDAQADFLRVAGCEQAQGYLFGRPLPAQEFTELLVAQAAAKDSTRPAGA